MKPLINLKSFLAVLLILIVPAALLVAYFRNYSSEAPAHEHGEKGKSDGAAMGKGEMSAMKPGGEGHAAMGHDTIAKGGDKGAVKPGGDSHAAGHDTMPKPQGGQAQPKQQAQMTQQPAAQPQKEGGHAAMGHGDMAKPSTAQSQPQAAQATPQPAAAAASPVSAPTGVEGPRSMKSMSSMGEGAEPAGMQAMGRVKDLTGSGKGTELISRLFHAGAKDFFLDHAQHLTLSTEQQKRLSQIKEQALLDKASANRKNQEAEQQLWKSTSVDRPDSEEIETKVRQVEKLRADQRIGFIRAVDQAAKVLTAEQRQAVLGGTEVSTHQHPQTPASKGAQQPAEQKHEHEQPKKQEKK